MKLRRWEMIPGSSRGSWLIPEVEGLVVFCSGGHWQLIAFSSDQLVPRSVQGAPFKEWGQEFSGEKAQALLRDNPQLKRGFNSRAEAMEALRCALSPAPRGHLSELL